MGEGLRPNSVVESKGKSVMVSVHRDPGAGRAIQQPLEVETGKLIVSVLSNMSREGRYCASVAGFELSKGLEITLYRGIFVLLDSKRLEGA